MEAVHRKLNGTKGTALVNIPKGIKRVPKEKSWVPPLRYRMEVEPNITVLGVTKGMEFIPSRCMDT